MTPEQKAVILDQLMLLEEQAKQYEQQTTAPVDYSRASLQPGE